MDNQATTRGPADRTLAGSTVGVTGAGGFVGLHIAEALARAGATVVGLDLHAPDATASRAIDRVNADGPGRIELRRCDLRDLAAMGAALAGVTDVVHAAAITNTAARMPLALVDVHVRATQALLDMAFAGTIRRLVTISSAAVLRSPEATGTLGEDYPVTPVGTYAITKYAAERLVADARDADGIDAVALRLPALYGPYERPTGARMHMSLVYNAVRLALAGQPIRANGDGLLRDWTRAEDVASGVALVLQRDTVPHALYHLGMGHGVTHRETLEAVRDAVPGTDLRWVASEADANLPSTLVNARAALGIDRARETLGYAPRFGLRDGVADYVAAVRPAGNEGSDGSGD